MTLFTDEALLAMTAPNHRRLPATAPSFIGLAPSSVAASRAKKANRKVNTKPELALRRALWSLGRRFRKNVANLPGCPDVVFPSARVVVFCDGEFWHGRHWRRLRTQLQRRHNSIYWIAKIARNRQRDRQNTGRLTMEGWLVLRFWESDILRDPLIAAAAIAKVVQMRISSMKSGTQARIL